MVACDDRWSLSGDVVDTVCPRPEHDPEERTEYCLDHPVEHVHMFPRDRGPPTYAPRGSLRATMRWSGKRGMLDVGPRRGFGRGRPVRLATQAARPRHDLAGDGAHPVGGLVRRGRPGI